MQISETGQDKKGYTLYINERPTPNPSLYGGDISHQPSYIVERLAT